MAIGKGLVAIKAYFRPINNKIFRQALYILRSGLRILHPQTISRLVSAYVDRLETTLLRDFLRDDMLSVAIDCWTSPFQRLFLAICGYFIDASWHLHEVVLRFEPLSSSHSGRDVGRILVQVLPKHRVADQHFAITTDNASNNAGVSKYAREHCGNHTKGHHIPCLAHSLQLGLRDLLLSVKANPVYNCKTETWTDDMALSLHDYHGVGPVVQKL